MSTWFWGGAGDPRDFNEQKLNHGKVGFEGEFALEMIHRASLSHRNDAKNIHGKAGAACGISGFSFCISQLRNPLKAWTNFPQSPIKCHSRRNRNNFFCREWTDIKTRMQN